MVVSMRMYHWESWIWQLFSSSLTREEFLLLLFLQGETYTLAKAQHAYKSLVKIHEKSGKCQHNLPLFLDWNGLYTLEKWNVKSTGSCRESNPGPLA